MSTTKTIAHKQAYVISTNIIKKQRGPNSILFNFGVEL
jgi:hypothetical protein